jgi:hypothetical protein
MKYEKILKERELRATKESKKRVISGRPRKKQIEPGRQKQTPKRGEVVEKVSGRPEIAALGFEGYCSVMEF